MSDLCSGDRPSTPLRLSNQQKEVLMPRTNIVASSTGETIFYSPDPETYAPGQELKMPNSVTYRVIRQEGSNVYVEPVS